MSLQKALAPRGEGSSPKWLVKHAWNGARTKADWARLQGHEDEPLPNYIVLLFTRRHLKQCCSELTDCTMLQLQGSLGLHSSDSQLDCHEPWDSFLYQTLY